MSRYKQYMICKERGHIPGAYTRGDGFMQCLHCKTFFKYFSQLVEDGAPEPDGE